MNGDDLFGQLTEYYCAYAMFVAAGGRITENHFVGTGSTTSACIPFTNPNGEIYGFGDFVGLFGNMARKNENNFISEYEKKESSAQNQINKLLETFNGQ